MALTRSFKELVQKRVASDPAFGEALLREGIHSMLTGDVDTGKAILRDYIKATVGFEKLGEPTAPSLRASSACSAGAAIRRPATSSASSATCRNRPASSSTSARGRGNLMSSNDARSGMNESTIICPNCKTEIKLTESCGVRSWAHQKWTT
jgi:hypothetical protein